MDWTGKPELPYIIFYTINERGGGKSIGFFIHVFAALIIGQEVYSACKRTTQFKKPQIQNFNFGSYNNKREARRKDKIYQSR